MLNAVHAVHAGLPAAGCRPRLPASTCIGHGRRVRGRGAVRLVYCVNSGNRPVRVGCSLCSDR